MINTLSATFSIPNRGATWTAFDPSNNYLYVGSENNITAINTTTHSIVASVGLGGNSIPDNYLAYDPANSYMYVAEQGSGNITIISSATNSIVGNLTLFDHSGYSYLAYDPANAYMYAVGSVGNSVENVTMISSTNSIVGNITVSTSGAFISGIVYDPANSYMYVLSSTNSAGKVFEINTKTNSVVGSITVGGDLNDAAYDPVNSYMYITNEGSSSVSVINTKTNSVVGSLTVGMDSYGVAYDPVSTYIYVTNEGSSNVSVINSTTNSVASNFMVYGGSPEGIAYDPADMCIYVLNTNIPSSVSVITTENTYFITFDESNLPSGSTWYVNITGQQSSGAIAGNSYTVNLPNGTYSYSIVSTNDEFAPSHTLNSFNVTGSPETESIPFLPAYPVTFTESGLPEGTQWQITPTGQQSSGAITGNRYTVNLPNGTYSFSASSSRYMPSANSTFTVSGSSVSEHISFAMAYQVTFYGNGIPDGTTWYVNLSNGQSYRSSLPVETPVNFAAFFALTSVVSFEATNGTYSYTISTAGSNYEAANVSATPMPSAGTLLVTGASHSFTVDGSNVAEQVYFSYAYKTTFTESGLPSGAAWYVNLSNGQDYKSTTNSMSFSELNGTYSYTIATADKTYYTPTAAGTLTVNNSSVSESASFSKVLNKVTFTESGLSSGTVWYVNGTGVSEHSSSQEMVFDLVNGSYSFTVSNLSSYYTTTYQISVTVNGKSVTESVQYHHWAYISGTVSPGNATLTIDGKAVAVSSNGSFNVSVANGTYYVAASGTGYHSYSTNITIANGTSRNLIIDLKPLAESISISPGIIYGAIGGVSAVVIGIAFYTLRKRQL